MHNCLPLLKWCAFTTVTATQAKVSTVPILKTFITIQHSLGSGKVTIEDLEPALSLCTHLVYGYARLNFEERKAVPRDLDRDDNHYALVTGLKRRFPNLKILLGIGGMVYDKERTQQYHEILENVHWRRLFVQSACDLVKVYGFDGLNIAWEFPPIKPRKFRGRIGKSIFLHDFLTP